MSASQTELAVLAVLSIRPATGYAIREVVHRELNGFWSESFGQIYPVLSRLEANGLITSETGERTGSALHSLTAAGRERLLELMRVPPAESRPRNGTLLRLFFGELLGPESCADLVRETRAKAECQLIALAEARKEIDRECAEDPAARAHARYWLLTVSAGEHSARAAVEWAEETLAELARMAADQRDDPEPESTMS